MRGCGAGLAQFRRKAWVFLIESVKEGPPACLKDVVYVVYGFYKVNRLSIGLLYRVD